MEVYSAKPLSENPDPRIYNIALRALTKNLTIVVGAGISSSPPTNLPLAHEIAQKLKSDLISSGLAVNVADANGDDLLDVVDKAIKSIGDLEPIQLKIIELFPEFKTALPNYSHKAVALLLAEGVLVLSINWDTCIERVAQDTNVEMVACRNREEFQGAGSSARIPKLHGCAAIHSSLVVSSKQLEGAPWWAGYQLGAAIENSFVTFVGIGSLASYIRKTIDGIINETNRTKNVCVVATSISNDWKDTLIPQESLFSMSCESFLDAILRAITNDRLATVFSLTTRNGSEPPITDIDLEILMRDTVNFIKQFPADAIWLWLRRGVFPQGYGSVILDSVFENCILALTLISSVSPLLSIDVRGSVVSIQSSDFLIEFALARQITRSDILVQQKRSSLIVNRKANLLSRSTKYLVLCQGYLGSLPKREMHKCIVDDQDIHDQIDGDTALPDDWVSLEQIIHVHSKEELSALLGG